MRVVVSPHNVVNYPQGGGHFWVYLQYVAGLRAIGCDVWWMEEFRSTLDSHEDARRIATLAARLRRFGLEDKILLYSGDHKFVNVPNVEARSVIRDADLLLNFHQKIRPWLLEQFRRTALVDIDPGLLQYWITSGLLSVEPHDVYFTTGETVGVPDAKIPDCGLRWIRIRPPVSLEAWPFLPPPKGGSFTTVSGWWGHEWVVQEGEIIDNNKRAAFLRYAELPRRTSAPLELAIYYDRASPADEDDCRLLMENGWRVRHSHDVAGSPDAYQSYVQGSLAELSCAKASCKLFENAWVSDRTLCYLASGRPAVVEDTGRSAILPNGLGMFRFSTLEEAVAGIDEVTGNYPVHARAARELAELFDARHVAETIVRRSAEIPVAAHR